MNQNIIYIVSGIITLQITKNFFGFFTGVFVGASSTYYIIKTEDMDKYKVLLEELVNKGIEIIQYYIK